jgi:NAD(P)-dependent dehydrogenase (short-subunit alcohol dehydrogenase family)
MPHPVCIITGAGRGIGRATAMELDRLGWRLLLVSRTLAELRATASLCRHAATVVADVTHSDDVQGVIDSAIVEYGRIDAAVNCAGVAPNVPIATMTDDQFQQTMQTNLAHVFYMTRALWPQFKRQKGGAIVNVSSLSSRDPFNGFGAYAAAKAGVNLFSLVAAREGAPHNIRVHVVAPGAVETKMLRDFCPESAIPRDQTLDPAVVAKVIAQLVAGDLAHTSGEVIYVHK